MIQLPHVVSPDISSVMHAVRVTKMRIIGIFLLIASAYAGHAPYLGGDIQELIEQTKKADVSAQVNKPVTEKQKRDSSIYNSKFTDIAKAYAEGYKAAIKAVQARALIAKKRLLNNNFAIRAKSTIPSSTSPNNPYLKTYPPQNVRKSSVPVQNIANNGGSQLKPVISRDSNVAKSTVPGNSYNPAFQAQANNYANKVKLNNQLRNRKNMIPDNTQQSFSPIPQSPQGNVMASNNIDQSIIARSTIPTDNIQQPGMNGPMEQKSAIPQSSMNTYFRGVSPSSFFPFPKQVTVNPMEKSWIPMGSSQGPHNIVERSAPIIRVQYKQPYHPAFSPVPVALRSEEERSKIAKLNMRGLSHHRNVYFDKSGGDPFNGGGVLSRQDIIYKKKHRKRRSSEDDAALPRRRRSIRYSEHGSRRHLVRHRRSHMPYLGQNLDALGIIRARPRSWGAPQKKSVPVRNNYQAQAPVQSYSYVQHPQPAAVNPSGFNQNLPGIYRAKIPQPMGYMPSPMAMNFGQMYPYQMPQYPGFRSAIPNMPSYYNNQMPSPYGYPYPMQMQSGLIAQHSASVENKDSSIARMKKSTLPGPEARDDNRVLKNGIYKNQ